MTDDVIRELERYAQALESVAPPLGVEEVSSPRPLRVAPPSEAMRTVGSRRGWVVALGASALTLLLLGGVFLFGMLQPGPPAGESLSADPVVWSRLDDPALGVPGAVGDVQSFSIGLVAVGSAQDETGRSSPAVWLQDEDGAWSRVGVATFDGLSGELRAVAEHSGRLVVVGTDNASSVPAVWFSDTGTEWTRVVSRAFDIEGSEVRDIVVNFFGAYVAIGSNVWRSSDGLDWERTDLDGTGFALIEFPDGLLAGGVDSSGAHTAVWLSRDLGVTWNALPIESAEDAYDGSIIKAMTEVSNGFLAAGDVWSGSEIHPAVWGSADGYDWELIWVASDSSGEVKGIAASSDHVVMVGERDGRETFWLSEDDGLSWAEYGEGHGLLASDPGSIESLAVGRDEVFMVAGQSGGQATVWLGVSQLPSEPQTADSPPPQGWTCQARIENGAEWEPGAWDDGTGLYRATGAMACLDLQDIHYEPQQWKVKWEGTAEKLEVGPLVRFERGIHGSVYAETVVKTESGEWITPPITPSPGKPFTFVVMPHSFDKWVDISWTVTPCAKSACN
jgi:hypothetical protein